MEGVAAELAVDQKQENRRELELVCGLPSVKNGPWIWFGFAAGQGQTQAPI